MTLTGISTRNQHRVGIVRCGGKAAVASVALGATRKQGFCLRSVVTDPVAGQSVPEYLGLDDECSEKLFVVQHVGRS